MTNQSKNTIVRYEGEICFRFILKLNYYYYYFFFFWGGVSLKTNNCSLMVKLYFKTSVRISSCNGGSRDRLYSMFCFLLIKYEEAESIFDAELVRRR